MILNESIVEDAALTWFGELGYAVGHGPQIAPGEYAGGTHTPAHSQGERGLLVGRLRDAIRRLNPAIPSHSRSTVLDPAFTGLPCLLSNKFSARDGKILK